MKKKKINLSELRVESFVTHNLTENSIRGGASAAPFCGGQQITHDCPESVLICPHLTLYNCSLDQGQCAGGGNTGTGTIVNCGSGTIQQN